MQVVILNDGHRLSRAYPAALLAGVAGYDDPADLMKAAQKDGSVLAKAASGCDALDSEQGRSDVAGQRLRERLAAAGHDVVATPDDELRSDAAADFKTSYQAAVGAVLLQAKNAPSLREKLTKAAVALGTAVALTLSSGAATQVHAADMSKNALGALIGGALGSKIGKGNGKKIAIAAGTMIGYGIANEMQKPAPKPQAMPPLTGPVPPLPAGGNALEPEKQAKLQELQQAYSTTRGAYALALYKQLQASDSVMVDPRNKDALQAAHEADKGVAQAIQEYAQRRGEFVNAVEYMGKRGYDMTDFALQHTMAYSNITARDVPRSALQSAVQVKAPPQLVETAQYNP